ncbi:MAG: DUF721 domain-containing protein [Bacteroidales bacterium]|nr:DUF721 domain-containing protein [Bacteroidales bacterium]
MLSSNEYTLKEAIEKMLREFKIKHKINEIRLRESWERIMGKSVSTRTIDLRLSNKILYIKLESAALRNELSMSKEKIIKRLNEELGEKAIESVVLK